MSDDTEAREVMERLRTWRHDSWPADPSKEAADLIARLLAEREAARKRAEAAERAIREHNDDCQNLCGRGEQEAVACGYRQYFEHSHRRCTTCPTDWMIEWDAARAAGEQ